MTPEPYVIITPARDEADNLARLIPAVIHQTHPPARWVIVDNDSQDGTGEIVRSHQADHPFIDYVRTTSDKARNFSQKARAVHLGISRCDGLDYSYVCNLDADVTFGADFFKSLIDRLHADPSLGLVGGTIHEIRRGRYEPLQYNLDSVAGPVQFFRRECFFDIGGYLSLRYGGVDSAAESMARMYGWKVTSFPDITIYHHRRMGTYYGTILHWRFHHGVIEHCHGYHPLYEFLKFIACIPRHPVVIGSLSHYAGYAWAYIRRYPRELPPEVMAFNRGYQLDILKARVSGIMGLFT